VSHGLLDIKKTVKTVFASYFSNRHIGVRSGIVAAVHEDGIIREKLNQ